MCFSHGSFINAHTLKLKLCIFSCLLQGIQPFYFEKISILFKDFLGDSGFPSFNLVLFSTNNVTETAIGTECINFNYCFQGSIKLLFWVVTQEKILIHDFDMFALLQDFHSCFCCSANMIMGAGPWIWELSFTWFWGE